MPPKNFQLTFAWMFIATLFMGIAVWQAQVTVAKEAAAKHAVKPPPAKTRHAVRPTTGFTGNVVEDYVARCGKGMTDQEIQWAIEDFNSAGLDVAPPSSATSAAILRVERQHWYHAALVDALRLSPAQAAQAKNRLTELLAKAWEELADKKSAPGAAFTDQWLDAPEFQPWKLCDLTPEQSSITWKSPPQPSLSEQKKAADFLLQFPLPPTDLEERERIPLWAYAANTAFPLLTGQKLAASPAPDQAPALFLENLRKLHPAQLRMLLLREPQFVPLLRSVLSSQPAR